MTESEGYELAAEPTLVAPAPAHRFAVVISNVLSPVPVLVVLCLAVSWAATGSVSGTVAWGLLTAMFTAGIPALILAVYMRRGRVTDMHVRERAQRLRPLTIISASTAAGAGVVYLLDAPSEVVAMSVALLAGVVTTTIVTLWWKISFHTGVSSSAVGILVMALGGWLLPAGLLVAAIAWARVKVGAHTVAQTVVGAGWGLAWVIAVYLPLS